MFKEELLSKEIIKTFKKLDSNFSKYWDSLDEIDKKEILEELNNTIYDWDEEINNNAINNCS
jgi:hypothetical protein